MRADQFLVEQGAVSGRDRAGRLISEGKVRIGGRLIQKKSEEITEGIIEISDDCPYVSRGGLKLEKALEAFCVSVDGLVCADIGSSTGGFTDCLLQKGAKKVFAIDSGSDQLHPKLREDPRVVSLERTNARYMDETLLGEKVDLAVMDVSFISQTLLYPAIGRILKENGLLISLIKPQFEVGRGNIGKNGIVKNDRIRDEAVARVLESAAACGFVCGGTVLSPIKGGDGNTEFLAIFTWITGKDKEK